MDTRQEPFQSPDERVAVPDTPPVAQETVQASGMRSGVGSVHPSVLTRHGRCGRDGPYRIEKGIAPHANAMDSGEQVKGLPALSASSPRPALP